MIISEMRRASSGGIDGGEGVTEEEEEEGMGGADPATVIVGAMASLEAGMPPARR